MKSLSEILKEHFENTPKDILDKEWEELKFLNEFGPDVCDYVFSVFEMLKVYNASFDIKDGKDALYENDNEYYLAA